jgi:flavorubredoxin
MTTTALFENYNHRNLMFSGFEEGASVPANQHLIIHEGRGMLLDPGGHKTYPKVLGETTVQLGGAKLEHLFLSHQDPDIVAATNGWLMTTDATAWASQLWIRFIPHFGLDRLVVDRLKPIPDQGMFIDLNGLSLMVIPGHFLHSPGNFHVYDPVSRVYYSGDLGASVGVEYLEVKDFDAHAPAMLGFHQRYMAGNAMMSAWARMVRSLEIEVIAPQHGAYFRGGEMVRRFVDWCENLACGPDLMAAELRLPSPT